MDKALFDQASKLILDSSIGNKDDLIKLVSLMHDEDLKNFVDLISEDIGVLDLLSKNYESKKALSSLDLDAWNKLVREEEAALSKIH